MDLPECVDVPDESIKPAQATYTGKPDGFARMFVACIYNLANEISNLLLLIAFFLHISPRGTY